MRGRRTSATDQNGRTTYYTYEDADRRIAVTDPANNNTQYGYDTEDNLLSITAANGHITQFAYNARCWVTQTTFASTLVESYTYGAVGNLLSKTDRKTQTMQYVYDAMYRLTSKNYADQTSVEYAYDLAGKLQKVSDPTGVYGFAYDNMGRLIGTTTQYSYLPGLNFFPKAGMPKQDAVATMRLDPAMTPALTVAYDANGNTLSDPQARSFTWDFENRLTQVVNPSVGTTTFKYDPFGRRIYKQSPSFTSVFVYDGISLIETLNSSGSEVASYTQGQNIDETLAELRANTTDYYLVDGLGSVTSLSGSSGTVANTYAYDSFGDLTASSGTVRNYFQYTGREFDPETGIYEYRARYYEPSSGRFLSEDPIGFQIAPNFYYYVENDPIGHIDPSGLCPCNSHKVKLYYTPNYGGSGYPDYHWYRQDSNGGWSSKHGWAPVGPQVDPGQDAAASGYGVFCANMCAPNQNGTAPVYNPVPWNDPGHIHTNNCYSYACDRLHPPGPPTKPQPGGHNPPMNFTCADIIQGAKSDGLTLDYDVPKP